MFEAVPPGQLPKIINPKINCSCKLNKPARINANNGIIENCKKTPKIIALGRNRILFKSEKSIVMPMPNITSPNKKGIEFFKDKKTEGKFKLIIKLKKIKKMNESFTLTV